MRPVHHSTAIPACKRTGGGCSYVRCGRCVHKGAHGRAWRRGWSKQNTSWSHQQPSECFVPLRYGDFVIPCKCCSAAASAVGAAGVRTVRLGAACWCTAKISTCTATRRVPELGAPSGWPRRGATGGGIRATWATGAERPTVVGTGPNRGFQLLCMPGRCRPCIRPTVTACERGCRGCGRFAEHVDFSGWRLQPAEGGEERVGLRGAGRAGRRVDRVGRRARRGAGRCKPESSADGATHGQCCGTRRSGSG
mmetsp:Transcript_66770/g.207203  ORF Transcript_66770/g.207203 Transcript_66770/m.207203 type:complete len:251 (+) Transcript_66770:1157-1909(+)